MKLDQNMELRRELLKEILEDEKEYCFDRSYCSDDQWVEENGNETREEAYAQAKKYFEGMSVTELSEEHGDRYDYVLEKYMNGDVDNAK